MALMFQSNRTDDLKTDVLIIGSGPLGSTYARILAMDGHEVTMIDAGPQLDRRPGRHMLNAFVHQQMTNLFNDVIQGHLQTLSVPIHSTYNSELSPFAYWADTKVSNYENPNQDRTKNMPHAAATYAVGGMFTHWTGSAPRQYPPERSSLISPQEWDKLFDIAEKFMNVHNTGFESPLSDILMRRFQKRLGDRLEPDRPVQHIPLGAERRKDNPKYGVWTGADTVMGPLLDEPETYGDRFTILPEHRAQELVFNGSKVDHVVVQNLTEWETINVYADTVILAAGPCLTPQLLYKSGIRPDALGRYLNENPNAGCKVIYKRDVIDEIREVTDNPARDEAIPIPSEWHEPMIWIPVSENRLWHVQMHGDGRRSKYEGAADVRMILDLGWFGMVDLEKDNRITFDDNVLDRFGMPQITFEYELGKDDRARAHNMMQEMLTAAEAIGGFLPPDGLPHFGEQGSSLHFQSTVRMGNNSDDSVVDTNSKVWGVENLHLGTVGVIPTRMASNPTLTAVAIAVKGAYNIIGKDLPDNLDGI